MPFNFYQLYKLLNETNQEPVIVPIEKSEINTIVSLCDETVTMPSFTKVCSANSDWKNRTDWSKSVKMILNNEVIGFYVFSFSSIDDFIEKLKNYSLDVKVNQDVYEKIKNKKGIEGVSVGIKKEYRGLGYGKKLLEHPKNLGVDYIWGVQTKGISDIDAWTKRREILANAKGFGKEFWVTVQVF
jgi:hypothetical protein